MTVAETVGVAVWFYLIAANGSVYVPEAVLGGAVLTVALFVELALTYRDAHWSLLTGLALTEVVFWTQWAILVTAGMWGAEGIGPATVLFAMMLVAQHSIEHVTVGYLRPFAPQILVTSVVEALAATILWLFFDSVVIAVAGLFTLLFIEHTIRLTNEPEY